MRTLSTIVIFAISIYAKAQNLEVEGSVRITEMTMNNHADSVVVRLADGNLGVRNTSSLIEYQMLSISNDTAFLSNGGFVKLVSAAGWTSTGDSATTDKATKISKSLTIGDSSFECDSASKYSMIFDGINAYMRIPDDPTLHFGSGSLTIGCWFKKPLSSHPHQAPLLGNLITISTATIGLYITGTTDAAGAGRLNFFYRTSDNQETNLKSSKRVDDDIWHSAFAVKDSTLNKLLIYIDGNLDTSYTVPIGNSDSGQDFVIYGKHRERYMDGSIDNISLWNRSLTPLEVRRYHSCSADSNAIGLVGLWNLEEGMGSLVKDLSSNHNDATLVNNFAWTSDVASPVPFGNSILKIEKGDIEISNPNHGIIMSSPDGEKWRMKVDNMGIMSVQSINN